MALEIKIRFDNEKKHWFVYPEGEIDIYTSPSLKEKLVKALKEKEADILIDGEKLEYLDSTGLGTLISILKVLKEKEDAKKIYIRNLKPNIRKLFDITELDKVFVIEE